MGEPKLCELNPDARHLALDAHRRTPEQVLLLARQVLGFIDLDPASDADAQRYVLAKNYFAPVNDGLSQEWHGRVWLNPPGGMLNLSRYRGSSAAAWWAKLQHEFNSGRVTAFLFLAFTLELFRTAQRFTCRQPADFPFCIPKARLRFPSSNGANVGSPAAASAVVYGGPNVERFAQVFSQIGSVCSPS